MNPAQESSPSSESLVVNVSLRTRTQSGGEENKPEPAKNPALMVREFPRNAVAPPNKKYDHCYGQQRIRRGIPMAPINQMQLRPQGNIPAPGTYKTRSQYSYEFQRKQVGDINPRFRGVCKDNTHLASSAPASPNRWNRAPPTPQNFARSAPRGPPRFQNRQGRTPMPMTAGRPRSRTAGSAQEMERPAPVLVQRTHSVGSLFNRNDTAGVPTPAPRFKRTEPRSTAPRFGGPRARRVNRNGEDVPRSFAPTQRYEQNINVTLELAQRQSLSDINETTPRTYDVLEDTVKILNEWMHEIELEG